MSVRITAERAAAACGGVCSECVMQNEEMDISARVC